MRKRPVATRVSSRPVVSVTRYSYEPSDVYLRTRLLFAGRGLKRPET